MIYRLVILNGDRKGERVTVPLEPLVIGRDEGAGLRLNDPEVAGTHAEITHAPEGLAIRDLNSMNRLLLNHREVRAAPLKHGDVVEVGHTRFLVQAYVQAEVQGATPGVRRKRRLIPMAIAAGVVTAAILIAQRCHHAPQDAETPSPAPATVVAPTSAPPVLAPTGVTEIIQDDLSVTNIPRVRIRDGVTLTSVPPEVAEAREALRAMPTNSASDVIADAQRELANATTAMLDFRAREMLEKARAAITNESIEAADRLLSSIQVLKEDFLPAYAERAALYEQRGMLAPAVAQWETVVRLAPSSATSTVEQARAALARLGRAREEVIPPFAGRLRVAAAEVARFPESPDYLEMRLLNVRLAATDIEKQIETAAVDVEVQFYDRVTPTGAVFRSAAKTPPMPLRPEGAWLAGGEKTLAVTYVVPAGTAPKGRYYGFLMRVFYRGALQEEYVQPKDLIADIQLPDGPGAPGAQAAETTPAIAPPASR